MYYENFTPLGKFLYDLTIMHTSFMCRHKWLFYVLSYTWGILTTIAGLFVSLALLISGHKLQKYYWVHFFKLKEQWGGFSVGTTFVRDTTSIDSINEHEFGHTMQNTLFGPFAIFLCFIPSIIRYFIRNRQQKQGKTLKPYDSVWYEASASDCGKILVEEIEKCKIQTKD